MSVRYQLTNKAYLSDVTITNTPESFTHEMARKAADTEMERNYVTVILCAVDLYRGLAHNRKASSALCTLVEREKKSFHVAAKTVSGTRDGSRR